MKYNSVFQPIFICCIFAITILVFQSNWNSREVQVVPSPNVESRQIPNQVWVSLSVCWSSNTKFYNKKFFPYKIATQLSTRLWLTMTTHRTIVQVIYEEKDRHDKNLQEFAADLQSVGSQVELIPTSGMPCSLKAQLQRMFAFQFDYIASDDIIVTSDVDTFPMDPEIFKDFKSPGYKIWLFQYQEVLNFGFTFNMNFIGMKSHLWKELISVSDAESLVEKYRSSLDLKTDVTMWDYDQTIISRIILESGICSAPIDNKLWERVHLNAVDGDDSSTCFHGLGAWRDCNVKRPQIDGGCKRWHFHPFERKQQLIKKFTHIANNRLNIQHVKLFY